MSERNLNKETIYSHKNDIMRNCGEKQCCGDSWQKDWSSTLLQLQSPHQQTQKECGGGGIPSYNIG